MHFYVLFSQLLTSNNAARLMTKSACWESLMKLWRRILRVCLQQDDIKKDVTNQTFQVTPQSHYHPSIPLKLRNFGLIRISIQFKSMEVLLIQRWAVYPHQKLQSFRYRQMAMSIFVCWFLQVDLMDLIVLRVNFWN